MELGTEFTFQSTTLPQCCFKQFSEMRERGKFCDINFTVGERRVTAHRVILAAAMPLIGEMLTSENEIQMPDIEPTVLTCLIDYAYSCKLKITVYNVRDLLWGSCVMRMKEVQNACCNFVSQRLRPQNVLSFRHLANHLNLLHLKKIIDFYVRENFQEVSKTKEFLDSPFTFVRELITNNDLNVDSEERVLESVLRWVKASPSVRKGSLLELLRQIRMVSLKPLYLTDIVQREELIQSSVAVRDLVDEAKNYHLFPERRKAMCSFSTEVRHCMRIEKVKEETSKAIYSFSATKKCSVLHLDLTHQTWSPKDAKEYSISNGCFAVLDKKTYFFHEHVFEYDSANNKIRAFQPLPVPKKLMAAVALRNKIFLCGGYVDSFGHSNSVDCFDPEKNEWTQVDHMRTARYSLNAVSLEDYIYALGGRDKQNIHGTVERYSFVTGKWQYLSSMLTPRHSFGVSVLNGKIYVCGGYETVDGTACMRTAEVYDPFTRKWNLISPMNAARRSLSLVTLREELYAVSGADSQGKSLSTCEVYDPETNQWRSGPSFTPLHRGSVAVVM